MKGGFKTFRKISICLFSHEMYIFQTLDRLQICAECGANQNKIPVWSLRGTTSHKFHFEPVGNLSIALDKLPQTRSKILPL